MVIFKAKFNMDANYKIIRWIYNIWKKKLVILLHGDDSDEVEIKKNKLTPT